MAAEVTPGWTFGNVSAGSIEFQRSLGTGTQGTTVVVNYTTVTGKVIDNCVLKTTFNPLLEEPKGSNIVQSNIVTNMYKELHAMRMLDLIKSNEEWDKSPASKLALHNCIAVLAADISAPEDSDEETTSRKKIKIVKYPACLVMMLNLQGDSLSVHISKQWAPLPKKAVIKGFLEFLDGRSKDMTKKAEVKTQYDAYYQQYLSKMNGPLRDIDTAQRICAQLVDALEYMHGKGYTHGDIFGGNICVHAQDKTRVVLIDFGFTKPFQVKAHDGTIRHIPFEYTTIVPEPDFAYISSDAAAGHAVSRRGEMENLFYFACSLCGIFPWREFTSDPEVFGFLPVVTESTDAQTYPAAQKQRLFTSRPGSMKDASNTFFLSDICSLPSGLQGRFRDLETYIGGLAYEDDIDYSRVKDYLCPAPIRGGPLLWYEDPASASTPVQTSPSQKKGKPKRT